MHVFYGVTTVVYAYIPALILQPQHEDFRVITSALIIKPNKTETWQAH